MKQNTVDVRTSMLTMSITAPSKSNNLTVSSYPLDDAICRGVRPWIWILKNKNIDNILQLTLVISNSMGPSKKIRINRSSTQEELRRYRKRGLFNNQRETTRAKFWRAKTSIVCPYSRNDFKHIRCFCCCFFLSVKFFESCETTDNF
jgi:hypothetical protein